MSFNKTRGIFKHAIEKISRHTDTYAVSEAAFPAYAHKNPIIDYVFWKRLKLAYDFALKNKPETVLDFGCGSGVLSYSLAEICSNVVALDIETGPLNLIKEKIAFPSNIEFLDKDLKEVKFQSGKFDLIIALDVLEHVDNLNSYIEEFSRILSPGGTILVSGPTENIFYKIGRKLAGNKFTGDYHVTDIHHIRRQFETTMSVNTEARILWPVTLFELFSARKAS
jgi:2-polyprenyl-3-methyl-5-hydroxy-6-metoxy-1,4-benzoquinol methylase